MFLILYYILVFFGKSDGTSVTSCIYIFRNHMYMVPSKPLFQTPRYPLTKWRPRLCRRMRLMLPWWTCWRSLVGLVITLSIPKLRDHVDKPWRIPLLNFNMIIFFWEIFKHILLKTVERNMHTVEYHVRLCETKYVFFAPNRSHN